MPPRSVCLNVFTTSLGSGSVKKESEVVVRETKAGNGDGAAEERARHDSVQEGAYCFTLGIFATQSKLGEILSRHVSHRSSDSIATSKPFAQAFTAAHTSPIASTTIDVATLPADIRGIVNPFFSTVLPTTCSTCTRPPPSGHSLLRCSRCKRAYYCSRTCQKQAWKTHKADCDPTSSPSPYSVLDTPDVSMPGSPATAADEHQFNLAAPVARDVASQCGAIQDAMYGLSTTAH
ncbi:MYND finger [Paraphaeosphaeria sporulosa]